MKPCKELPSQAFQSCWKQLLELLEGVRLLVLQIRMSRGALDTRNLVEKHSSRISACSSNVTIRFVDMSRSKSSVTINVKPFIRRKRMLDSERHPEVVKQCPSFFVVNNPGLKAKPGSAAVRLAEPIQYGCAGTLVRVNRRR